MKRLQALLILIALLAAPFLKAPAWYFCSMRPGPPQAACCCGPESGMGSTCCKIVQMPLDERFGSVAPVVSAPDLSGILAPAPAVVSSGAGPTRPRATPDRAPPWPPGQPLYLLHSCFLS